MEEIAHLKHQIKQEQKARKQAEQILESKSLELFEANKQLRQLNENLENQIKTGVLELQKTEKRYQELIESLHDIIYKTSPEGFFTYVNPFVEQLLGFTENEIIGLHYLELVLPEYHKYLMNFYQTMVLQKQESAYLEFPITTKSKKIVWIGQTVRLIEIDNKITELVAVARDITDRKKAEELLETTQTRLSTLIKNTHKGVLVEDENRKVILVNQLFCEIFNITVPPESLVGMDSSQFVEQSKFFFTNPEQFVQKINEIL